jgi:hypothetical protein
MIMKVLTLLRDKMRYLLNLIARLVDNDKFFGDKLLPGSNDFNRFYFRGRTSKHCLLVDLRLVAPSFESSNLSSPLFAACTMLANFRHSLRPCLQSRNRSLPPANVSS